MNAFILSAVVLQPASALSPAAVLSQALSIPDTLLPRVLGALAIIAAGLVGYRLLNRLLLVRAQKNQDASGEPAAGGVPSILYFTTPDCAACKTVQRPALRSLQERLGDRLKVIEIDAQERPDLASRWGVLSVPTTFIIDANGQLRHVNHGVTRAEKLLQQLERSGGVP